MSGGDYLAQKRGDDRDVRRWGAPDTRLECKNGVLVGSWYLPELSWLVVAIVIVTLMVVGMAAAWLPAHRAAKVTPLEALQSE